MQLSVHRIALLAILIALCLVGRLSFQFIPNFQPMTTILMIIALNIPLLDSFIVSLGSVFLTNIFLGMGPWTFFQILTYTIILLLIFLFKPFHQPNRQSWWNRLFFTLIAVFIGFLYGFVISIFTVNLFGLPNFWVYYLQGLSFDAMHAIGNGIFYVILNPFLTPLLKKRYPKPGSSTR